MALDLFVTNLAEIAERGHRFEVKLPDGSPTGFYITVRGDQSPKVKAYVKQQVQRAQQKQLLAKRKSKEVDYDYEELLDMQAEAAKVRVITWEGLLENGKEVKPTPENIERIMAEQDWIASQVIEEATIAANFT